MGTQSQGVLGETTQPVLSLASAVDALKKAAAPEPVAHIVASCVTLHATYESAIARCFPDTHH